MARRVRLWPPNGHYVTVDLAQCIASVEDACGGSNAEDIARSARIVRYGADEPEGCTRGGGDLVLLSPRLFNVRAERRGHGDGRVYWVEYSYVDRNGGRGVAQCEVEVPHSSRSGPVRRGPLAWTRTVGRR